MHFLFIYVSVYHDENVNEDEMNFFFKGCRGIILTIVNLKQFFFCKSKCPMEKKNQNTSCGVEPIQVKLLYFVTQWRVPACVGACGSYSLVSQAILWSLFFCLLMMSYCITWLGGCKTSRRTRDSWFKDSFEELSFWRNMFLKYEVFNFEMSEYIESYSFQSKTASPLLSRWLFWRVNFSDIKQCFSFRRVVFHIRKCMKRERSTEN